MKYIYRAYDANGNLLGEGNSASELAQTVNTTANKVYKSIESNNFVESKKWSDTYIKCTREEDVPENVIITIEDVKKEALENEEWRILPGYPQYCISNKERAAKLYTNEFKFISLTSSLNKTGRKYKTISINGFRYRFSRAVWRAFRDPDFPLEFHGSIYYKKHPEADPTKDPYYNIIVDHKPESDEKDLNDMLENLQAMTSSQNLKKARAAGKVFGKQAKRCYAKKDNEYYEFETTIECVEFCLQGTSEKPNSGRFSTAIHSSKKNPDAGIINGYKVGYLE